MDFEVLSQVFFVVVAGIKKSAAYQMHLPVIVLQKIVKQTLIGTTHVMPFHQNLFVY